MRFDPRLQHGVDVYPERVGGFGRGRTRVEGKRALWPADAFEEAKPNLIAEGEHEPARVEQTELEKRIGFFAALAFDQGNRAIAVLLGDRAGCYELITEAIFVRSRFAADRGPRSEQKGVLDALPAELHAAAELRAVEVDQKARERDLFESAGVGYRCHSLRFRTCRGRT